MWEIKLKRSPPQESVENGGYKAHLHWGIAKAPFSSAVFAGYAENTNRWYNPIAMVGKENNPGRLRYNRLLF